MTYGNVEALIGSNISHVNGTTITLKAGKNYSLEASIAGIGSIAGSLRWFNLSTGLWIGNVGTIDTTGAVTRGLADTARATVTALGVDVEVEYRVLVLSGFTATEADNWGSGWLIAQELA